MPHRHPSLISAPPAAPGRRWLTNARLFDGTGAAIRQAAAVLIEDGTIERVGAASEPAPEGARVIDLGGRTLIPGLINVHVHVQARPPVPAPGAEPILAGTSAHFLQAGLRDILRMGTTTLRNVGGQAHQPRRPGRRCAMGPSVVRAF